MAPPEEGPENTIIDEEANVEFCWGVKRGRGTKGKDIQFYDSFTYDGVEYSCYDSVYLHKEGEPEPYIGKIMKIWEDRKLKKNRIKVMWFFRPIEIRNFYEGDCSPANKELFLASGEGKGVSNVNLLEVLVGKCKVLCTSTDPRNPQPSEEDLNSADFFFNRTFDCGERMVSESFEGIEAEAFLNKQAWVSNSVLSLGQQTNGAIENRANKSMANGSLFLRKEGAKVDMSTKEGEPKNDKTSQTKLDNNEIQEEEMKKIVTVKGEVKGNEIPKEELKTIESVKEELKVNGTPDEELKIGNKALVLPQNTFIDRNRRTNYRGQPFTREVPHQQKPEKGIKGTNKSMATRSGSTNAPEKKLSKAENELPAFSPENLQNNMRVIYYSRTFLSIMAGVVAGILGLTGWKGFIFYFMIMILTSLGVIVKTKFDIHEYFDSWNRVILDGISGGLMSFVLFWTFAYDIVHIF